MAQEQSNDFEYTAAVSESFANDVNIDTEMSAFGSSNTPSIVGQKRPFPDPSPVSGGPTAPKRNKKKKTPTGPPIQKNALMQLNEIRPGLQYILVDQSGHTHSPSFTISVEINGHTFTGTAPSKKKAKSTAAEKALAALLELFPDSEEVMKLKNSASSVSLDMTGTESEDGVSNQGMSLGISLCKPQPAGKNPVMILNELRPGTQYQFISETGDNHNKVFEVEVTLEAKTFKGSGRNKKLAKARAAQAALKDVYNLEFLNPPEDQQDGLPIYIGDPAVIEALRPVPSTKQTTRTVRSKTSTEEIPFTSVAGDKHPVQKLNELYPGIEYVQSDPTGAFVYAGIYTCSVDIDGHLYEGIGSNKKDAKVRCANSALEGLAALGLIADREAELAANREAKREKVREFLRRQREKEYEANGGGRYFQQTTDESYSNYYEESTDNYGDSYAAAPSLMGATRGDLWGGRGAKRGQGRGGRGRGQPNPQLFAFGSGNGFGFDSTFTTPEPFNEEWNNYGSTYGVANSGGRFQRGGRGGGRPRARGKVPLMKSPNQGFKTQATPTRFISKATPIGNKAQTTPMGITSQATPMGLKSQATPMDTSEDGLDISAKTINPALLNNAQGAVKIENPAQANPVAKLNQKYPGLEYKCLGTRGDPPYNQSFTMQVTISNIAYFGAGRNKKLAKQATAEKALKALGLWTAADEEARKVRQAAEAAAKPVGAPPAGKPYSSFNTSSDSTFSTPKNKWNTKWDNNADTGNRWNSGGNQRGRGGRGRGDTGRGGRGFKSTLNKGWTNFKPGGKLEALPYSFNEPVHTESYSSAGGYNIGATAGYGNAATGYNAGGYGETPDYSYQPADTTGYTSGYYTADSGNDFSYSSFQTGYPFTSWDKV